MEIAEYLVTIRNKKLLKQKDAAALIGVSQTHLSQLESGKKELSAKMLDKIAKAYDVPKAIILFLSLGVEDVPEEKKELFKHMQAPIINLINAIYNV